MVVCLPKTFPPETAKDTSGNPGCVSFFAVSNVPHPRTFAKRFFGVDKTGQRDYHLPKALPRGGGEALVKGAFLALGTGGLMVSHIELFTFCLVIIGVIGLTVGIMDFIRKRK